MQPTYYHIKMRDIQLNIRYVKCISWEVVVAEINLCQIRLTTVIEVRDNTGAICPH